MFPRADCSIKVFRTPVKQVTAVLEYFDYLNALLKYMTAVLEYFQSSEYKFCYILCITICGSLHSNHENYHIH